jgi:hypothetical protein
MVSPGSSLAPALEDQQAIALHPRQWCGVRDVPRGLRVVGGSPEQDAVRGEAALAGAPAPEVKVVALVPSGLKRGRFVALQAVE